MADQDNYILGKPSEMYRMHRFFLIPILLFVDGCVSPPPSNLENICNIFYEYPEWRQDTLLAEKDWNIPVAVQMAIMHQESKFDASATPPRTKLLWFIPWSRPSSAHGYTQALHATWQQYQKDRGGYWASRENFSDAVDFIGWYANIAHKKAGIPLGDAYGQYLAYHEGVGGYMRKSYLRKPWLIQVAKKVQTRAIVYDKQLQDCGLKPKSK